MSKLRVHCFGVSIDGFGAGPNQSLENPLGVGGERMHEWFIPTRVFQKMLGKEEGTTGVDNDFAERGFNKIGAWILGRNMFGPIRGSWPDDNGKAGGVTSLHTTHRFLYSLIIRAPQSKCREAQRFILSLTAFMRRCNAPKKRRMDWIFGSVADRRRSGNIFKRD